MNKHIVKHIVNKHIVKHIVDQTLVSVSQFWGMTHFIHPVFSESAHLLLPESSQPLESLPVPVLVGRPRTRRGAMLLRNSSLFAIQFTNFDTCSRDYR